MGSLVSPRCTYGFKTCEIPSSPRKDSGGTEHTLGCGGQFEGQPPLDEAACAVGLLQIQAGKTSTGAPHQQASLFLTTSVLFFSSCIFVWRLSPAITACMKQHLRELEQIQEQQEVGDSAWPPRVRYGPALPLESTRRAALPWRSKEGDTSFPGWKCLKGSPAGTWLIQTWRRMRRKRKKKREN